MDEEIIFEFVDIDDSELGEIIEMDLGELKEKISVNDIKNELEEKMPNVVEGELEGYRQLENFIDMRLEELEFDEIQDTKRLLREEDCIVPFNRYFTVFDSEYKERMGDKTAGFKRYLDGNRRSTKRIRIKIKGGRKYKYINNKDSKFREGQITSNYYFYVFLFWIKENVSTNIGKRYFRYIYNGYEDRGNEGKKSVKYIFNNIKNEYEESLESNREGEIFYYPNTKVLIEDDYKPTRVIYLEEHIEIIEKIIEYFDRNDIEALSKYIDKEIKKFENQQIIKNYDFLLKLKVKWRLNTFKSEYEILIEQNKTDNEIAEVFKIDKMTLKKFKEILTTNKQP
ncbi:MAG: hypothetical protein ACRC41_01165, partial [Sarcina sp.]